MKRLVCILLFFFVCLSIDMQAQPVKSFSAKAILEPYTLEVSYYKTTHLVFPFPIISIDRGSSGILAQKAPGVENILKVKADQKGFEETSLSVITSDGKLYSFLVCYNANPAFVSINLDSVSRNDVNKTSNQEKIEPLNERLLAHYAKLALSAEKNIRRLKEGASRVSIAVEGIYVKEGTMFLRFHLQNGSTINYDIDQLRLYIRDKEQSKRTAVQEKEMVPLLVEGNRARIKAGDTQTIVLALPKFTLANGQCMALEMTEENGGRNLLLKLKAKHIMKAKPLD